MEINELFGSMVFGDAQLKLRLSKDEYESLRSHIMGGISLSRDLADVVAAAMKDWAVSKGVTHYTHWFQPMTGITAEKHDSFIEPDKNGGAIMNFSGSALIKGESDASSFPSGGLRATFEARGYTAWDPTTDAFIKDNILCIPTVFFSYGGYCLDKKTPLLRSSQALNKAAMNILKLFGNEDVKSVIATVGAEQEYFLIDQAICERRKDLLFTGRTLFGAKAPKGQEMEDHYYGALKPRVQFFMKELDYELWKLGVFAKTEHNEVAPSQHELAPIYTNVNVATDHNQLTMEMMKRVATRHKLACILHEKPFANLNGSGKHDNWSICTDTGINLLEPGKSPSENLQFLVFLTAMIKACDEHADLLRLSVATAANDLRLGGNEAPPATISIFLGDELTDILFAILDERSYNTKEKGKVEVGVEVLPQFTRDATDRNRTSPFAFTGNKFEFRMPGSALSLSGPNMVLNTIMAESLSQFYEYLSDKKDLSSAVKELIRQTIKKHGRIIFNGNSYCNSWATEAKKRGLISYPTTVSVLPHFTDEKNVALFEKYGIFKREEMKSRQDILIDSYSKTVHIEALTMIDMLKHEILPAALEYISELSDTLSNIQNYSTDALKNNVFKQFNLISDCYNSAFQNMSDLSVLIDNADVESDRLKRATLYSDSIRPIMQEIRQSVDLMEENMPAKYWTIPTYAEILYSVN